MDRRIEAEPDHVARLGSHFRDAATQLRAHIDRFQAHGRLSGGDLGSLQAAARATTVDDETTDTATAYLLELHDDLNRMAAGLEQAARAQRETLDHATASAERLRRTIGS